MSATGSTKWNVLAYPESFPNAIEFLKEKKLPFAAILHDRDVHEDGTPKKPHWHIVLKFGGPLAEKTVRTYLGMPEGKKDDPNGFQRLQVAASIEGSIQYLIHKNDPDKAQYDQSEIISSFSVSRYFREPKQEFDVCSLFDLCLEQEIHNYKELVLYAYKARDQSLMEFIRKNTYFLQHTIGSFEWDFVVTDKRCKDEKDGKFVKATMEDMEVFKDDKS